MPWGASKWLAAPRVFGSTWAGITNFINFNVLLGVNNVRGPAEGRAVPVLDLPVTVGLISLILAQKGGVVFCKDAVNGVKMKACGIMKTWQPKEFNCGPIISTVCNPVALWLI